MKTFFLNFFGWFLFWLLIYATANHVVFQEQYYQRQFDSVKKYAFKRGYDSCYVKSIKTIDRLDIRPRDKAIFKAFMFVDSVNKR